MPYSWKLYYPHMPIGKVWIYRLLFVCALLFVCTVTDFFAENKASGVKFCTAVCRRPRQGISHFGELCFPRSPKSDESRMDRAMTDLSDRDMRATFVEYRVECGRRIGMCGYMAVPQDGRTCCLFVRLRIYPPRIILAASNFARRFIGIQGRKSPIFVSFASQEPKIGRMGERAGHAHPHVNITVEMRRRKRHARDAPSWNCVACGRKIGMLRYKSGTDILVFLSFGNGAFQYTYKKAALRDVWCCVIVDLIY